MIDKRVTSTMKAVEGIFDGATMLIVDFGDGSSPIELTHALIDLGAKYLTVVNENYE